MSERPTSSPVMIEPVMIEAVMIEAGARDPKDE
jgi:hypothetical protein